MIKKTVGLIFFNLKFWLDTEILWSVFKKHYSALKGKLKLLNDFSLTAHPVLSFGPPFPIPEVLCDPTDFIWRKGASFEAMTGHTAFINRLLAEVFRSLPQL